MQANSEEPDQTSHHAVSDLELYCLPMSHKKGDRLIWAKAFCSKLPNKVYEI